VEERKKSINTRGHCTKYMNMMVITRDIIGEVILAKMDENDGEESRGALDIYNNLEVMYYLKHREITSISVSTKEKDWILLGAKEFV